MEAENNKSLWTHDILHIIQEYFVSQYFTEKNGKKATTKTSVSPLSPFKHTRILKFERTLFLNRSLSVWPKKLLFFHTIVFRAAIPLTPKLSCVHVQWRELAHMSVSGLTTKNRDLFLLLDFPGSFSSYIFWSLMCIAMEFCTPLKYRFLSHRDSVNSTLFEMLLKLSKGITMLIRANPVFVT